MRSISPRALAVFLVAVVAAIALNGPIAAGDAGEKQVRVKKIVRCEDGDCTETVENIDADGEDVHVMVGDDGAKHVKIRKVVCDGDDCEEHEGAHKMVFVGGDGDVEIMSGAGGYSWVHGASHMGGKGGFLGVGLTELSTELREHFGAPSGSGVMVSQVVDGSPAFKAGVMVGDIITAVDGEEVANGRALGRMISDHQAGDEVVLEVWRGGAAQSITSAVEERSAMRAPGVHKLEHLAGMGGEHVRKIVIKCDDEDENCDPDVDLAGLEDFDCGSDECEVKVECDDGGCECTINGESADCSGIPGVPGQ